MPAIHRCLAIGCTYSCSSARSFIEHSRRTGHQDDSITMFPSPKDAPPATHPNTKETMKAKPLPTTHKLGAAVARKRGDRSLRELAKELEESHTTLQHVENGRPPRTGLFIKLVAWLGVIDKSTERKLMDYVD